MEAFLGGCLAKWLFSLPECGLVVEVGQRGSGSWF